jgi:hypothetical protein
MPRRRLVGVLCLSRFFFACGDGNTPEWIVGRWTGQVEGADARLELSKMNGVVLEYTPDAKTLALLKRRRQVVPRYTDQYKINGRILVLTLKSDDGKAESKQFPFKVTKDELTLSDSEGQESVLKRTQ